MEFDFKSIISLINTEEIDAIEYCGYGQRVENFLPPAHYRPLFTGLMDEGVTYGNEYLVINVRGAEILDGRHLGYLTVPSEFYADLIERTGLRPVFVGQLGTDAYSSELRERFPQATFQPSMGARGDFATLLKAKHLVPSVSTFSWIAAWLSEAETIHLPMLGLYNPLYGEGHDFAPVDDPRYNFWWFPAAAGCALDKYGTVHEALNKCWQFMPTPELATLKIKAVRQPRVLAQFVRHYEEQYYLGRYQDIRLAVPKSLPNGLVHYIRTGFSEGRTAWKMDPAAYLVAYPEAAWRIGRGEFSDVHHHYACQGASMGYNPCPPIWC